MDVSERRRNSGPARIGALATLPVFFDLKGKPVLSEVAPPGSGRPGVVSTAARMARAGRHVVQLVSGDPARSFRTRAEIADLRRTGVATDVIREVDAEERIDGPSSLDAGTVRLVARPHR